MECELEQLARNLHLVIYPNTLWGAHIEPTYKYIAFLHISVEFFTNISVDKAIVVCRDQHSSKLKLVVLINNQMMLVPSIPDHITSVSDITHAIGVLNDLRRCGNYFNGNPHPQCHKFINLNEKNDYCMECAPSLVNELENFILHENPVGYAIKDKRLNCSLCDKTLSSHCHLKEHERLHTGARPYLCEICNKTSSHRASHIKHMLTHSNDKPFLCSTCGKSFTNKYRMDDHVLTHNVVKRFECNICFKKFTKNSNLKVHVRSHTEEKPYMCNICGKSYTTPSNLSTHKKSAHNETKPYPCLICEMSFVHPRLLRIHMRKHTGEKPYTCNICAKSFSRNIHLTVHIRSHTGERPYLCNYCDKSFTTTGNLNNHRKVHHKAIV